MKQYSKNQKPIILLNIDSLMSLPLETAAQTGHAPALQFLMEKGFYIPNMVSSFPTMSVTIDSTLITGAYADKHHIPGLNWYDDTSKQIINYGTGLRETSRIGVRKSIHNMLYRLNNEHLSNNVSTIYEDLANKGIPSASINSFVYRGNSPKRLQVPRLLSTFTRFEDGKWTTNAPPIFSLGLFSKIRMRGFTKQIAAGNHKYTAKELRYLVKKNKLPSFTFCIFQDLDARIHFRGPMDIKGIAKIDKEIQKTFNLYPSWEDAVKQNIWMVMGDNGHSPTGGNYQKYVIDLRKILKEFRISRIERKVNRRDQLVICVNQRMAYIYVLDKTLPLYKVSKVLKSDPRIDIIAWKDKNSVHVTSGIKDGELHFSSCGQYKDVYNQTWKLKGNHEILDLRLINDKEVSYGQYPDGLARLNSALNSHSGRYIIVNAKPGHDFKAESTPFHISGAAHGSLHRQESHVPLIIAGTSIKPKYFRLVDMKRYILQLILKQ